MREHRFLGQFKLVTPLCLSSGEAADIADTAVRRRADGTLVVPGTSMAGLFRTYTERLSGAACKIAEGTARRTTGNVLACGCAVCALFGDVRPGQGSGARASRLVFRDAVVEGAVVEIADGVAIDRGRRAASARRKFDFEEIVPGPKISVEVRGMDLSQVEQDWLGAAFRALGEGRLALGGRVAQGFGRFANQCLSLHWRDTECPEHVVVAVLNDSDATAAWPEVVADFPGGGLSQPDVWELNVTVATPPGGTLLVADPLEAVVTGFHRAPRGGAASPRLPATSFRGAFRAAAERILRTISPDAACDPTDPTSSCDQRERVASKDAQTKGQKPQVAERCLACKAFGNEAWASWLQVSVGQGSFRAVPMPLDHVAIDRFTGGAREGLKFDALAVTGAEYDVTLTAPALPDADRDWVTGLVALVLEDLHHGRWQVGHGAARGHGWLVLKDAPVFLEPLEPALRALWKRLGKPFPEVT